MKINSRIFSGWNFMRWTRLILGVLVLIQALKFNELFPGIVAMFLLYQAISNTGCCSNNTCYNSRVNENKESKEEINFEEIKK